jgi:hypothetical protein
MLGCGIEASLPSSRRARSIGITSCSGDLDGGDGVDGLTASNGERGRGRGRGRGRRGQGRVHGRIAIWSGRRCMQPTLIACAAVSSRFWVVIPYRAYPAPTPLLLPTPRTLLSRCCHGAARFAARSPTSTRPRPRPRRPLSRLICIDHYLDDSLEGQDVAIDRADPLLTNSRPRHCVRQAAQRDVQAKGKGLGRSLPSPRPPCGTSSTTSESMATSRSAWARSTTTRRRSISMGGSNHSSRSSPSRNRGRKRRHERGSSQKAGRFMA